jgi:nucleoside recognition membrane protein YjiH
MKVLFLFNFLTVMPVVLKIISAYLERRETESEHFRLLYSVLDFALSGTVTAGIWLMLITAAMISLLILTVFWGVLLYRMWLVIPAENRPAAPALLAVITIVPVIGAIASFRTVAGLSSRLAAQERREGVIGRRPSRNLSIIYCIAGIAAVVLPQIFLLFHYLFWIGVTKQLHDAASNILHQRLQEF